LLPALASRFRVGICLASSLLLASLSGGIAASARGENEPAAELADAEEFIPLAEWVNEDGLSGDDIYRQMLDNRFRAYRQLLSLRSKDRAENLQVVELDLKYLRSPKSDKQTSSRTIAKYLRPTDVRHLGYLVINKRKGIDDQFVYRPSARRVRRINVRSEVIAGTDFAIEDVIPQELEDGSHYRLADSEVNGIATYVVAVVPLEDTGSEYSKFVLSIEKEHFVPLQTDYWDNLQVHIKQLRTDPKSITLYEAEEDDVVKQVWIPNRSRMRHLKLESQTVLEVVELDANPGLRKRDFSQRELTASH
jgi:hypothetical protein